MASGKADTGKRFVAAAIDLVVAWLLSHLPFIGWAAGIGYILTRDTLIYELVKHEDWKGRSVGKKVAGLAVLPPGPEGSRLDWAASVKRNLFLVSGRLLVFVLAGALSLFIIVHPPADLLILARLLFLAMHRPLIAVSIAVEALFSFFLLAATVVPVLMESILALTDPEGRRWGDRWAGTRVVEQP